MQALAHLYTFQDNLITCLYLFRVKNDLEQYLIPNHLVLFQNLREKLYQFYKNANIDCEIFNFTDKIIDYYSKVNLVITRSGASVLGELINVKIPFISIPLPTSADNHQLKNASFYKKKGFGLLLEEKDIKNKLYKLILSLFKDKSLINNILSNQRQYSDKDIYQNLITEIEKILNEKN